LKPRAFHVQLTNNFQVHISLQVGAYCTCKWQLSTVIILGQDSLGQSVRSTGDNKCRSLQIFIVIVVQAYNSQTSHIPAITTTL